MNRVTLASFFDELDKIAGNTAASGLTDNTIGKPAPISSGAKPASTMKTEMKPTNYSMVHGQVPAAPNALAQGSKLVPPPPVRT